MQQLSQNAQKRGICAITGYVTKNLSNNYGCIGIKDLTKIVIILKKKSSSPPLSNEFSLCSIDELIFLITSKNIPRILRLCKGVFNQVLRSHTRVGFLIMGSHSRSRFKSMNQSYSWSDSNKPNIERSQTLHIELIFFKASKLNLSSR